MSNPTIDLPAAAGEIGSPRPTAGIYYGWACVVAAALAMVATLPGRTMGLGLVTESLLHDLKMSRTQFSHVNSWATIIGAAFGLSAGRLLDRFGARAVTALIVLGLGLTVWRMSRLTGPGGLLVTVTLTRGLGQSALSVASIAIVGKWFEKRSGQAMGVYAVLLTVGFMAALRGLETTIRLAGWQRAWGGMGLILAAGVAPLLWLLVRDGPEAVGLRVDGGPQPADGPPPPPTGYTLSAAAATPAFWALALGAFLFNTVYSGITLFITSVLAGCGYHGSVSRPLIVMVFTSLPTNFAAGWLASRGSVTKLMGAAVLLLGASLAALPRVRTPGQVMAFAALLGVSAGIVTVVFFACWGKLYGRRHLGRIQGAAQVITVFASAAGPAALAWCLARYGSYAPAFRVGAALSSAFGACCLLVREPPPGPPGPDTRPA